MHTAQHGGRPIHILTDYVEESAPDDQPAAQYQREGRGGGALSDTSSDSRKLALSQRTCYPLDEETAGSIPVPLSPPLAAQDATPTPEQDNMAEFPQHECQVCGTNCHIVAMMLDDNAARIAELSAENATLTTDRVEFARRNAELWKRAEHDRAERDRLAEELIDLRGSFPVPKELRLIVAKAVYAALAREKK